MKHLPLLLLSATLLSSCSEGMFPGMEGKLDGKSYLSKMDGPQVPTVDSTLLSSAADLEKSGDFRSSAQIYKQLLDKNPKDTALAYKLAESLRKSGEYDPAISLYDTLLADDAKNADLLEGKALALLAKGEMDAAGALLTQVQKISPDRPRTLNAAGILFASRNMTDDAHYYFARALEKNPASVTVLNNMGLLYAVEDNTPQAISTLRQASALAGSGTAARKNIDLNLAMVYGASGKMAEAESIAKQYFSGAALSNNMGLYAHLAQNDSLAKTYFNMALSESKTYYERAWKNLDAVGGSGKQALADTKGKQISFAPAAHDISAAGNPAWVEALRRPSSTSAAAPAVPVQSHSEMAAPVEQVAINKPLPVSKEVSVQASTPPALPAKEEDKGIETAEAPATIRKEAPHKEEKAGKAKAGVPAPQEVLATSESLKTETAAPSASPSSGSATESKPEASATADATASGQQGDKPAVKNGFQALGQWMSGAMR